MQGTEAKIIADSVSRAGARITTLQLCYPRFIHAEFMTHRAFSRNSSSSRAIPVQKMIEQARHNPAMPIHWGANQSGMQAEKELQGRARESCQAAWQQAAQNAADAAQAMMEAGLHKQVANRVLEPFQWIHTVVTATDWDNFFALRCHPAAQPEIRHLACLMREAIQGSTPEPLDCGQWHLPYVTSAESNGWLHGHIDWRKVSAARCARVSYLKHDGTTPNLESDLRLFEKLAGNNPIHASPLEHQAIPAPDIQRRSRNFTGWIQFREIYEEM